MQNFHVSLRECPFFKRTIDTFYYRGVLGHCVPVSILLKKKEEDPDYPGMYEVGQDTLKLGQFVSLHQDKVIFDHNNEVVQDVATYLNSRYMTQYVSQGNKPFRVMVFNHGKVYELSQKEAAEDYFIGYLGFNKIPKENLCLWDTKSRESSVD